MTLETLAEEITRLSHENARLREALEELCLDPGNFCCACPEIRDFAKAVLQYDKDQSFFILLKTIFHSKD